MSGNIYISGESSNNKITISGSGEKKDIDLSTKEANNNLNTQNNNAKYYSDKALESANKAKQSAEEAKQSAQVAQDSASSILNDEGFIAVSQNLEPINAVANSIDDVSYVASNVERIEQIVEALNNLGDTTNINIVATNIDTVNTTANNINSVNDVADSINSVNEIANNLIEVLNSKIYSENAKESETRALNYADNASISADLAQEWAVSSNLVENTDYSSKYYANQAKTSATTATNQATIATNKANEAISALDSTLDYSRITNCLLEVPQNIKLELVDGVLTLKAGSKAIVPNGVGVFKEVVTTQDQSITYAWKPYGGRQCMVFVSSNGTLSVDYMIEFGACFSNSETGSYTYYALYDTINNKVKMHNDTQLSLPIAIITQGSDGVTKSIVQVFNGFGFIGSVVWADKGVKGLIPNGRNEDGTLKNINVLTSKVLIRDLSPLSDGKCIVGMDSNGFSRLFLKHYYYDSNANYSYNLSANNAIWRAVPVIQYICENQKLIDIQFKQPFRAVDYNDKQEIVSLGMPDMSNGISIVNGSSSTPNKFPYPIMFYSTQANLSADSTLCVSTEPNGNTYRSLNIGYSGNGGRQSFSWLIGANHNFYVTNASESCAYPLKGGNY